MDKMTANKFWSSKVNILIGIVIATSIGLYFLDSSNRFASISKLFTANKDQSNELVQVARIQPDSKESIKDGCTRTERLVNDPQYDRALSLINQRVDEDVKWWEKYGKNSDSRFKYFPANLTNCIKIIEKELEPGEEGYFIFNGDEIKPNYFPIVVDKNYIFSDDTLTALLVTHEMTHIQQYIDSLNNKDALSCRDKEVEAYISQLKLYVILSNEEIASVSLKMKEKNEDKHPQVTIIKTMISINQANNCKFSDFECSDTYLRSKLFEIVTQTPGYQQQCKF